MYEYVTRDEYELQFSDNLEQILAYTAGRPIHMINPEALEVRRILEEQAAGR